MCSVWSGVKMRNLIDLEKCCNMNIYSQQSASLQPRTSRPRFGKIYKLKVWQTFQIFYTKNELSQNRNRKKQIHFVPIEAALGRWTAQPASSRRAVRACLRASSSSRTRIRPCAPPGSQRRSGAAGARPRFSKKCIFENAFF